MCDKTLRCDRLRLYGNNILCDRLRSAIRDRNNKGTIVLKKLSRYNGPFLYTVVYLQARNEIKTIVLEQGQDDFELWP